MSADPKLSELSTLLNLWNRNIFNPFNPNYHNAYTKLFNKAAKNSFDMSDFKFIAIFEKDDGIKQQIHGMDFIHVYETIIDITAIQSKKAIHTTKAYISGYEAYHQKSVFIDIDQSKGALATAGIFSTTGEGKKFVSSEVLAYLVRGQDATSCTGQLADYQMNNFEQYLQFVKKDIIEELYLHLNASRVCEVKGASVVILNALVDEEPGAILKLCKEAGGQMESMKETIAKFCNSRSPEYKLAEGHADEFKITCGNYASIVSFDQDSEISGLKISHEDILKQFAIEHYEL